MKIAVNTRFLLAGKLEGFGKFTYEIFKRVVLQHPEHTFYFLFDRPYDPQFIFADNVKPVVLYPPARHPLLFYVWYQVRVAQFLKKEGIDLFVSPDNQTCLATQVPTLTVLHDLAFEHFPEHLSWADEKYFCHFSPKFAAQSTRLVAVSEFTRNDISKQYGTDPDKIDVVYNAASQVFSACSVDEQIEFRNYYTHDEQYFVYVGAIHPRKNLVRVLQAFDRFRTLSMRPVKLLVVGRKAWKSGELEQVYNHMVHRDDVIFSGRLTDEQLRLAYCGALALVYVPLLEGFGIPIVEAQRCDCPVITSNVTSMPEVAGGAALLADPFSVEHIAAAMTRVASDEQLRHDLARKGRQNVQRFSWNHSARQMWQAMEKTLQAANVPLVAR